MVLQQCPVPLEKISKHGWIAWKLRVFRFGHIEQHAGDSQLGHPLVLLLQLPQLIGHVVAKRLVIVNWLGVERSNLIRIPKAFECIKCGRQCFSAFVVRWSFVATMHGRYVERVSHIHRIASIQIGRVHFVFHHRWYTVAVVYSRPVGLSLRSLYV